MDKIIDVEYNTNSDIGTLTTSARLNLATGYVDNIEMLENAEDMNTVYSETVSFVLDNTTYEFEISSILPEENVDGYYIRDYKNSPLYQYLNLNNLLSDTPEKTRKLKM